MWFAAKWTSLHKLDDLLWRNVWFLALLARLRQTLFDEILYKELCASCFFLELLQLLQWYLNSQMPHAITYKNWLQTVCWNIEHWSFCLIYVDPNNIKVYFPTKKWCRRGEKLEGGKERWFGEYPFVFLKITFLAINWKELKVCDIFRKLKKSSIHGTKQMFCLD